MPLTEEWEQAKLCRLLPSPLYVLYSQTAAYTEACDSLINVNIVGDVDEARSFHTRRLLEEDEDDDSNNVTNEEEDDNGEGGKKGKRGRGKGPAAGQQMSKQEERLRKLLQAHPLQVQVRLRLHKDKEDGADVSVLLTFSHVTRMQIVAVKVKLEDDQNLAGTAYQGSSAGEVLQSSTLLSHLLETGDAGAESPNPANRFLLAEAGYPGGAIPDRHLQEVGSLYMWAQLLAGLQHPEKKEGEDEEDEEKSSRAILPVSEDVSFSHVGQIMKSVRSRVEARLALQKQITQLERAKHIQVEPAVPEEAAHLFPADSDGSSSSRGASRIRNWTLVDWEQYTTLEVTRHLVEAKAVSGEDFFFRLQVFLVYFDFTSEIVCLLY